MPARARRPQISAASVLVPSQDVPSTGAADRRRWSRERPSSTEGRAEGDRPLRLRGKSARAGGCSREHGWQYPESQGTGRSRAGFRASSRDAGICSGHERTRVMIGPDQYITYTLLEEPGLTIRESTERERAERWPPPFGGSMPSDVPKYVVVALAHEHEHNWICSVFGLPQGGETREEAVFWAERFASKNGYRFVPPEGWEDVVGALSPEDVIEGSGRDHTLARSTDPKTSHAADA